MSTATEKDYFGSFLSAASAGPAVPPVAGAAAAPSSGVERQILTFLSPKEVPVSVRELLTQLDIPPSLAITALNSLRDAKLVELNQVDGDECVAMTDLGRRIAA